MEFTSTEAYIQGTSLVSCAVENQQLLYCGMDNVQTEQFDTRRYAIPINSTTCECHDNYGMKCVAWCTNEILEGFEIVVNRTDPLNTNELLATCSLGKLVVGCHLEPIVIQDKNYFGSRVYYPYNYGSSCYCNDYQGSKCIALCALNINKYEIAQNYGRGMVRASCTRPENNLLGCGLFVNGEVETAFWRYSYTFNEKTCLCFANVYVVCYAVCGVLE